MSDSTPSSSDAGLVRRRRWFRFSLRTLLIVFTGFTIWFGLFFDGVRRQYQAAEAIQAAYGQISYDWQVRSRSVNPGDQPGPAWLRARLGPHWFDEIDEVRLNEIGNPGPANQFSVVGPRLVGLPRLNSLSLWGRERKHADYQLIGQLTQLKKLRLYQRSEFTREHAAALSQATALRELNFDGPVSADALRELARFPTSRHSIPVVHVLILQQASS